MTTQTYDKDVKHFGVKGMRWGVRRTPAQLARASKERSTDAVSKNKSQSKLKKSGIDSLSNKEIQDLTNRINLENNLKSATARSKQNAGKKFAGDVLKVQGKQQANKLVRKGTSAALTAAGALIASKAVLDFTDLKI